MTDSERLEAQQKLTIDIQILELEAARLGCLIGAQSLNRAKNAVGWEMAGNRDMAADAARRFS